MPSFISTALFELLSHLLSPYSSPIADSGHIMNLFKMLSADIPNQIIFHVLSSVNSYNSLNNNLDGHFTYIILIFPTSLRWAFITILLCFENALFKKSHWHLYNEETYNWLQGMTKLLRKCSHHHFLQGVLNWEVLGNQRHTVSCPFDRWSACPRSHSWRTAEEVCDQSTKLITKAILPSFVHNTAQHLAPYSSPGTTWQAPVYFFSMLFPFLILFQRDIPTAFFQKPPRILHVG